MFGIDFAFICEWTEVKDWVIFTKNNIKSYSNISEFLNSYK